MVDFRINYVLRGRYFLTVADLSLQVEAFVHSLYLPTGNVEILTHGACHMGLYMYMYPMMYFYEQVMRRFCGMIMTQNFYTSCTLLHFLKLKSLTDCVNIFPL